MAKIEDMLNIPEIKPNTNFWMIRTKRGFFFDEFIRDKFIAIGWNSVNKSMLNNLTKASTDNLKLSIKQEYNEDKPGNALNKCLRFCNELKVNDITLIVDNHRMAIARIGEYYEVISSIETEKNIHNQIAKANRKTGDFPCPYSKRRAISIIKTIQLDNTVNPYLQNAISRNWHSLSDLNEYAELILSICYDVFIFQNKLTATFRVRKTGDIAALELSTFIGNTAALLSINNQGVEKHQSISVKTSLHSPGDIILQIANFCPENLLLVLLCYIIIFGGRFKDFEFNSLFSFVKYLLNRNYEEQKRELELRKLSAETDLAEQNALKAKLENIEKMRQLHIDAIDKYAEPLSIASQQLEITPDDKTIISLEQAINQLQEKRPS